MFPCLLTVFLIHSICYSLQGVLNTIQYRNLNPCFVLKISVVYIYFLLSPWYWQEEAFSFICSVEMLINYVFCLYYIREGTLPGKNGLALGAAAL